MLQNKSNIRTPTALQQHRSQIAKLKGPELEQHLERTSLQFEKFKSIVDLKEAKLIKNVVKYSFILFQKIKILVYFERIFDLLKDMMIIHILILIYY